MRSAPPHALREILGHANLEMVRRYWHLAGDLLRRAVDAMGGTGLPGEGSPAEVSAPTWHQPAVTEEAFGNSSAESGDAPAQNRTGT